MRVAYVRPVLTKSERGQCANPLQREGIVVVGGGRWIFLKSSIRQISTLSFSEICVCDRFKFRSEKNV